MTNTTSKRVLFVDDEPEQVEFHVRALKDAGYEVELISSSTTALELCLRAYAGGDSHVFRHDLLILDMMMPPPEAVQLARVDGGLATGAYILAEHHKHHAGVPTVILSNLSECECVDAIRRVCKGVLPAVPEDAANADLPAFLRRHLNVTICEKRRTPPFLLPSTLRGLHG